MTACLQARPRRLTGASLCRAVPWRHLPMPVVALLLVWRAIAGLPRARFFARSFPGGSADPNVPRVFFVLGRGMRPRGRGLPTVEASPRCGGSRCRRRCGCGIPLPGAPAPTFRVFRMARVCKRVSLFRCRSGWHYSAFTRRLCCLGVR